MHIENTPVTPSAFAAEWLCLQNNHEQYERLCLWVKLAAVVLSLAMLWGASWLGVFAVLVLWLQEAILRTSQARLGARILRIETILRAPPTLHESSAASAFQLHSEWLAARPGAARLLREYLGHALRPTVGYPYVVLLVLPAFFMLGARF